MIELFIRKPSGDSEWTEDASQLCKTFAQEVQRMLQVAEEDGPVDLRDFQTVLKYAVDDVIGTELVRRRLDTAPETGWASTMRSLNMDRGLYLDDSSTD